MAAHYLPAWLQHVADDANSAKHPGLQLDKLSDPREKKGEEKESRKRQSLEGVCTCSGDTGIFATVHARWRHALTTLNATTWDCVTTSPMSLHLARAAALENVGICLHPVYGFAYIPGSGLKGMARAYAETIWKPAQAEPKTASDTILHVFGNERGEPKQELQQAGAVVFHDAWPTAWPKLEIDVAACHHPAYYRGEDAPGDWEDPNPIEFLTVVPGTAFTFALSARRGVDAESLALARQWLTAALGHLGAGAKSAAGYGAFKPVEGEVPAMPAGAREVFDVELKLVTPAFLAGARQSKDDCDLRPATLRGQLRWWWRTMHAAHLSVDDLRRLEGAIWGNTEAGSPVQIRVEKRSTAAREPFRANKDGLRLSRTFQETQGIERSHGNGLLYIAYGMADGDNNRYSVPASSQWKVSVTIRQGAFLLHDDGDKKTWADIPRDLVRQQIDAAFQLFCRFGGAGSKARKGFGSFADLPEVALQICKDHAKTLRDHLNLRSMPIPEPETPALESMILSEIPTPWKNPWFALNQVGAAYKEAVSALQPKAERRKIGMPRKDHRAQDIPERHASPLHLHLASKADGTLVVRAAAFPAKRLPNYPTSRAFLETFNESFTNRLEEKCGSFAGDGQSRAFNLSNSALDTKPALELNTIVQAELLDEKTKKGGWRACSGDMTAPITNTADVPPDTKPGDRVELYVATRDQFLWPTDEVRRRMEKNKKKTGHDPRRSGGRPGPGSRR